MTKRQQILGGSSVAGIVLLIAIVHAWTAAPAKSKVAEITTTTPKSVTFVAPDPGIKSAIDQANQLETAGKPDEAIAGLAAYAAKVGNNPSAAEADVLAANILVQQSKYSDAKNELDKAQKIDPNNPNALPIRARLDEGVGDVAAAIKDYSAASTQFTQATSQAKIDPAVKAQLTARIQAFQAEISYLNGLNTAFAKIQDRVGAMNLAAQYIPSQNFKAALLALRKALALPAPSGDANQATTKTIQDQITALSKANIAPAP